MRMSRLFLSLILLTTTCFGQNLKPVRGMPFVNRGHKLGSGLVAGWLFNEGSGGQVFDLSGNGYTGTIQGTPAWGVGKYGSALISDATLGGIATGLRIGTWDELTVIIWLNDSNWSAGTDYYIDNSSSAGLAIRRHASTAFDMFAYTSGGAGQVIISAAKGENCYALVHGGGLNKGYVNGIFANSAVSTGPLSANNADIAICSDYAFANEAECVFHMAVIYNRALTASEIALLYREPFCMFAPTNPLVFMSDTGAAPGVVVTPYYYRTMLFIPIIPFGFYCYLRRRKCAA